ncbi:MULTISPECIES: ISC system 2Fe-2S type ferredoxin [unclassified Undibacterium]|uniref:ISC system 2Fe-2S type ferredoxin n=1 Tax=unclassified Undibacterium TaxID=2630295 RepID=UPI002AC8D7CD|nr:MULTISPECIES: ISC system 2Fe-2S type ferredoxin [unclassified Undibacterium]MEB0138762.1 ISC system 2Fe-2S type ferredoxin [Undibacterium sp. CCC2.1]MEB0170762.1 ISC system 2Fe-2S type ferredoxin [Undibacterium sp. CCC1.1]MEB0174651.1 ISC system 2Fe-2S type ferredoxin [Undibacterium sp. CCC3.4]MEB0213848.1 ISC system 2Fe-2S type ferredoxin [Undibacterium sp. 5I2]WPX42574.1 ISC system 2Fe-2S type ferredoxin [Undibacterium sp. CCC3.4]
MPTITILPHPQLCPSGAVIEAEEGKSLCEAMVEHAVEIEHACEMSCACTTCHVVIRAGLASLNASTEEEEDLLDAAWGLEVNSRLSCQVKLGKQDITIEIPKYTINHARENH